MRTKQGLLALLTCSAVAMGGLTVEAAAAQPAPAKAAKKAAKKKKSKRCKILLVNGVHRCKGDRAPKKVSVSSSTAPTAPAPIVNNVTINNIDNPPVPAPAAATATATAPVVDEVKPGKGPKPKKDKKSHPSH